MAQETNGEGLDNVQELAVKNVIAYLIIGICAGIAGVVVQAEINERYPQAVRAWEVEAAEVESRNQTFRAIWDEIREPTGAQTQEAFTGRAVQRVFLSGEPMTVADWETYLLDKDVRFTEELLTQVETLQKNPTAEPFVPEPAPAKPDEQAPEFNVDVFADWFGSGRWAAYWTALSLLVYGGLRMLTQEWFLGVLSVKNARTASVFLVLLNAPAFVLAFAAWLFLVQPVRGARMAGRVARQALSDRFNPYARQIREARRCLAVLVREGADTEALEAARTTLELWRTKHAQESQETEEARVKEARAKDIAQARDSLMRLLAEPEADGDTRAQQASKSLTRTTTGS